MARVSTGPTPGRPQRPRTVCCKAFCPAAGDEPTLCLFSTWPNSSLRSGVGAASQSRMHVWAAGMTGRKD